MKKCGVCHRCQTTIVCCLWCPIVTLKYKYCPISQSLELALYWYRNYIPSIVPCGQDECLSKSIQWDRNYKICALTFVPISTWSSYDSIYWYCCGYISIKSSVSWYLNIFSCLCSCKVMLFQSLCTFRGVWVVENSNFLNFRFEVVN